MEVQMVHEKRVPIITLILAVAAALALAGCGDGSPETDTAAEAREETAGTEPGTGGATQEDDSPAAAGDVGPEEGMLPPGFTLSDLDGEEVSLSDFEGKVVVLDLWATWCPPCRKEIPFLVELYDDLENEGLVVLGVGLDQGGRGVLAPFAEEYGITYPVLVGDRAVQAAYRVTSIPTTFLIGRDGRIAVKHVGFSPSMEQQMRDEVMALLTADVEA
ncbi:MAG: redoxin domain-containing protein [Candidatus Eisenbacteria bacterium]|nr:redoxin domain-containing protein [Candidatus Eisenbacteria bacterium]